MSDDDADLALAIALSKAALEEEQERREAEQQSAAKKAEDARRAAEEAREKEERSMAAAAAREAAKEAERLGWASSAVEGLRTAVMQDDGLARDGAQDRVAVLQRILRAAARRAARRDGSIGTEALAALVGLARVTVAGLAWCPALKEKGDTPWVLAFLRAAVAFALDVVEAHPAADDVPASADSGSPASSASKSLRNIAVVLITACYSSADVSRTTVLRARSHFSASYAHPKAFLTELDANRDEAADGDEDDAGNESTRALLSSIGSFGRSALAPADRQGPRVLSIAARALPAADEPVPRHLVQDMRFALVCTKQVAANGDENDEVLAAWAAIVACRSIRATALLAQTGDNKDASDNLTPAALVDECFAIIDGAGSRTLRVNAATAYAANFLRTFGPVLSSSDTSTATGVPPGLIRRVVDHVTSMMEDVDAETITAPTVADAGSFLVDSSTASNVVFAPAATWFGSTDDEGIRKTAINVADVGAVALGRPSSSTTRATVLSLAREAAVHIQWTPFLLAVLDQELATSRAVLATDKGSSSPTMPLVSALANLLTIVLVEPLDDDSARKLLGLQAKADAIDNKSKVAIHTALDCAIANGLFGAEALLIVVETVHAAKHGPGAIGTVLKFLMTALKKPSDATDAMARALVNSCLAADTPPLAPIEESMAGLDDVYHLATHVISSEARTEVLVSAIEQLNAIAMLTTPISPRAIHLLGFIAYLVAHFDLPDPALARRVKRLLAAQADPAAADTGASDQSTTSGRWVSSPSLTARAAKLYGGTAGSAAADDGTVVLARGAVAVLAVGDRTETLVDAIGSCLIRSTSNTKEAGDVFALACTLLSSIQPPKEHLESMVADPRAAVVSAGSGVLAWRLMVLASTELQVEHAMAMLSGCAGLLRKGTVPSSHAAVAEIDAAACNISIILGRHAAETAQCAAVVAEENLFELLAEAAIRLRDAITANAMERLESFVKDGDVRQLIIDMVAAGVPQLRLCAVLKTLGAKASDVAFFGNLVSTHGSFVASQPLLDSAVIESSDVDIPAAVRRLVAKHAPGRMELVESCQSALFTIISAAQSALKAVCTADPDCAVAEQKGAAKLLAAVAPLVADGAAQSANKAVLATLRPFYNSDAAMSSAIEAQTLETAHVLLKSGEKHAKLVERVLADVLASIEPAVAQAAGAVTTGDAFYGSAAGAEHLQSLLTYLGSTSASVRKLVIKYITAVAAVSPAAAASCRRALRALDAPVFESILVSMLAPSPSADSGDAKADAASEKRPADEKTTDDKAADASGTGADRSLLVLAKDLASSDESFIDYVLARLVAALGTVVAKATDDLVVEGFVGEVHRLISSDAQAAIVMRGIVALLRDPAPGTEFATVVLVDYIADVVRAGTAASARNDPTVSFDGDVSSIAADESRDGINDTALEFDLSKSNVSNESTDAGVFASRHFDDDEDEDEDEDEEDDGDDDEDDDEDDAEAAGVSTGGNSYFGSGPFSWGSPPSAAELAPKRKRHRRRRRRRTDSLADGGRPQQENDLLCTFTETGNTFTEQHWYYCYTCDLTAAEGCCTTCVRVCHKDHDVSYARFTRFFCDCGAGVGAHGLCIALTKRTGAAAATPRRMSSVAKLSRVNGPANGCLGAPACGHFAVSAVDKVSWLPAALDALRTADASAVVHRLLASSAARACQQRAAERALGAAGDGDATRVDHFASPKQVRGSGSLIELQKFFRGGTLDVKLKIDGPPSRILRSLIAQQSITRSVCSATPTGSIAVAEGAEKRVVILDGVQLLRPAGGVLEKSSLRVVTKVMCRMDITWLEFNPAAAQHLAVCGPRNCQVLTFDSNNALTNQLAVTLALDDAEEHSTFVVKSAWLPDSETCLAVLSNAFVKIFDLSEDSICPNFFFTIPDAAAVDLTFAPARGTEPPTMYIMTRNGIVYVQPLGSDMRNVGECFLTEQLDVPRLNNLPGSAPSPSAAAGNRTATGQGLFYSARMRLLVASFSTGPAVAVQLAADSPSKVTGHFALGAVPEQGGGAAGAPAEEKLLATGLGKDSSEFANQKLPHLRQLNRFVEIDHPDPEIGSLLLCHSRVANYVVAVTITQDKVNIQPLKLPSSSASRAVEGLTAVAARGPSGLSCGGMVLLEDGSLFRFAVPTARPDSGNTEQARAASPLPSSDEIAVPSTRASIAPFLEHASDLSSTSGRVSTSDPTFPIDFFERSATVSNEILYSCKTMRDMSADMVKELLLNHDVMETRLSAATDRLVIGVQNPNPSEVVIVGVRILLGQSAPEHVPERVEFFGRSLRPHEGRRRWYDVPFTDEEILSVGNEFQLAFVAGHGAGRVVIDGMDVHAMSKEAFGWAEKAKALAVLREESDRKASVAIQLQDVEVLALGALRTMYHLLAPGATALTSDDTRTELLTTLPGQVAISDLVALHGPMRTVLRLVAPGHETFQQLTTSTLLERASEKCVAGSDGPKSLVDLLHWTHRLADGAADAPVVAAAYLADHPDLLGALVTRLTDLFDGDSAGAASMRLMEASVLDLVELALVPLCASADSADAAKRAAAALGPLILSSDEPMRRATANALFAALGPQPGPEGAASGSADLGGLKPPKMTKDESEHVLRLTAQRKNPTQYRCNLCDSMIAGQRWHCTVCSDFDLCESCHNDANEDDCGDDEHRPSHAMSMFDDGSSSAAAAAASPQKGSKSNRPRSSAIPPRRSTMARPSVAVVDAAIVALTGLVPDASSSTTGRQAAPLLIVLHGLLTGSAKHDVRLRRWNAVVPMLSERLAAVDTPMRDGPAAQVALLLVRMACLALKTLRPPSGGTKSSTPIDEPDMPAPLLAHLLVLFSETAAVVRRLPPVADPKSKSLSVASSAGDPDGQEPAGGKLLKKQSELRGISMGALASERSDSPALFADFETQALVAVMRLTSALARAVPSVTFDDAWKGRLCDLIGDRKYVYLRTFAKRLLSNVCRSKAAYYVVRDFATFRTELDALASYDFADDRATYEQLATAATSLSNISSSATSRPDSWRAFCREHPRELGSLFGHLEVMDTSLAPIVVHLLALAFGPSVATSSKDDAKDKSKVPDKEIVAGGGAPAAPSPPKDMDSVARELAENVVTRAALGVFADRFLLDAAAATVRAEARDFLYGLWLLLADGAPTRQLVMTVLVGKVPHLAAYGKHAVELIELLAFIVETDEFKSQDDATTKKTAAAVLDSLRSQLQLVDEHPNSFIYSSLAQVLETDGFYLESDPCLVCNTTDVPFTTMREDSMRAEVKYTGTKQLVRFGRAYTLRSLRISLSEIKAARQVKTIDLYYSNKEVKDAADLRTQAAWKKARVVTLEPGQTELTVSFPVPITATNFMFEYTSFHEDYKLLASQKVFCPRCSSLVTDKFGVCSQQGCNENAYQCRACRNICYEDLDAFLCNECGFCKWMRPEFSFSCHESTTVDRIETEDERRVAVATMEKHAETVHRRYETLQSLKEPIVQVLSSSTLSPEFGDEHGLSDAPAGVTKRIGALTVLYNERCKTAFSALSKALQIQMSTRNELVAYARRTGAAVDTKRSVPSLLDESSDSDGPATGKPASKVVLRAVNRCFGCALAFMGPSVELLTALARHPPACNTLVEAGCLDVLFAGLVDHSDVKVRENVRKLCSRIVANNEAATRRFDELVVDTVAQSMANGSVLELSRKIRGQMALLEALAQLDDDCWPFRLQTTMSLLERAIDVGQADPALSEIVILPCLRILSVLAAPPAPLAGDAGEEAKATATERDDAPTVSHDDWVVTSGPTDSFASWQSRRGETGMAAAVRRCATKWLACIGRSPLEPASGLALGTLGADTWLGKLLLSPCSSQIRDTASKLVDDMCRDSEARSLRMLDLLASALEHASELGDASKELFVVFARFVAPRSRKLYLVARGFLGKLCGLISTEVARIRAQETERAASISQGFVLKSLTAILVSWAEVPNIRTRLRTGDYASGLVHDFLVVRGLIMQKTQLTDESGSEILDLLRRMFDGDEEDKARFLRAWVSALDPHGAVRSQAYVLEQMCAIVAPEKPEPDYFVVLNKSHTQEEFIRGQMTKNPYSVKDVGPLMRDVKNKICNDLELFGLIEDDNGMELLVANQIVKLDLPVTAVFEQVWVPHQRGPAGGYGPETPACDIPPMTVVYRLQGLDGEATEDVVDEVKDSDDGDVDPEVEFKVSAALSQASDGLERLVALVQAISNFAVERNVAELVLKLLYTSSRIRVNRLALARAQAQNVLLDRVPDVFANDELTDMAEQVLSIIEAIVVEANASGGAGTTPAQSATSSPSSFVATPAASETRLADGAADRMRLFLSRYNSDEVRSKPRLLTTMTRIMPSLTYGKLSVMQALFDEFRAGLEFEQLDAGAARLAKVKAAEEKAAAAKSDALAAADDEGTAMSETEVADHKARERQVASFVSICENIPLDENGRQFRDFLVKAGVVSTALAYLREHVMPVDAEDEEAWSAALSRASVAPALQMLSGLSAQCPAAHEELTPEMLVLLHRVENVTSLVERVGTLAENVLEVVAEANGALGAAIETMREQTREANKARAAARRDAVLKNMGFKVAASDSKMIVAEQASWMEDLEDEEGLTCMICQEGYTYKPEEPLGFYTFCKRVQINYSSDALPAYAYSTVTHFNVIHYDCHEKAARADRTLKTPKDEWDGATIRNSHTKCNNLFPLLGPKVPPKVYSSKVDQFWNGLVQMCGSVETKARFHTLLHDMRLLLGRYATHSSFSEDSHGGGSQSNMHLWVYMMQMGMALLDGRDGTHVSRANFEKAISLYLTQPRDQWVLVNPATGRPNIPTESATYMLVLSLFVLTPNEWKAHRMTLLKRAVVHGALLKRFGPEGKPDADVSFADVKSALVFFALVDQLQGVFKTSNDTSIDPTESASGGSGGSDVARSPARPGTSASPARPRVPSSFDEGGRSPGSVGAHGGDAHLISHHASEAWVVQLKAKLRDEDMKLLDECKTVLEMLNDELLVSEDAMELLDVAGVLSETMSEASTPDAFIDELVALTVVAEE